MLSDKLRVTIKAKDIPVKDLLTQMLTNTDLVYTEMGNNLVGIKYSNAYYADKIIVKGTVTDGKGNQLENVSVTSGKGAGTTTNGKGEYTISVDEDGSLTFSFVGFTSQTVKVERRGVINVMLEEGNNQLSDVIVVGYGKDSRATITSAVSTLKTDNIVNAPYTDIQSAIQGRVPGVQVYPAGGEPGSVPTIQIRGGEPLIGLGGPIYIIDGVQRGQDAFVALNPGDIASISFLKDAASTAVYGMNSAGGVILITTKQGQNGKMRLTYSDNLAWNTPINFPQLVNSYQYAVMTNAFGEAAGSGKYSVYSPTQLDTIKNHLNLSKYPDVNWYNQSFKKYAMQQRHNIDITGGNEKTKYYIGIGYFNQGSNYVNNAEKLDRFSYRSNITSSFDKIGLDVTFGINGFYSYQTAPPDGSWSIFSHIVAKSPLTPAYNPNGTLYGVVDNPLAQIFSPGYARNQELFNDATLTLKWQVPGVKGLVAQVLGDYNLSYYTSKTFTDLALEFNPDGTAYQTPAPTLTQGSTTAPSYDLQFNLNYTKDIGKNHLQATFVSEARAGSSSTYSTYRGNFASSAVDQLFAGDPSTQTNTGSASEYGNLGYVGRIKYDYDGKYLLEANGRYDGSDDFPPGKRFGFFPSVSVGYVISKEGFYKNEGLDKVFNFLKWRGSYGITGSLGGVPRFAYVPVYNINSQVYVANGQLVNGYSEGGLTISNQNLTWEKVKSYDWGIDYGALNNHISGSFDYFFTSVSNIIGASNTYSYTAPLGQSLPSVITQGQTRKEGFDFDITYKSDIGKNANFYVGFNCTYYNYLWSRSLEDSVTLANPYIRQQGVPQTYYSAMYLSNGLYQNYDQILNNPTRITSTALMPGDISLIDANGDGQINSQDYRNTGYQTNSRFVFGVNFGFSYKGLSVDGLLNGSGRRDVYLGNYLQDPGVGRNNYVFQYDYWTANNKGASFPRITTTNINNSNNFTTSDFWLVNAEYLRLKTLTIGYDFNKMKNINKLGVFNELTLFVSGTNLLTFSPCKKYFDPELADANNFYYPVNKTYSFGIRAGF